MKTSAGKMFNPVVTAICFVGMITLFNSCYTTKLENLAPTEQYPDDTWLNQQTNKRALIIVAHDDDALGCAGTITQLCEAGWEVSMFCLYPDVPAVAERNAQRQSDILKVQQIEGLSEIKWHQFIYRKDLTTSTTAYYPIALNAFDTLFYKDTLMQLIQAHINRWKPSVLFTLDDQIGGYGHPEHRYISQLAKEAAFKNNINKGGTVQRVYQAVFTPSQAEKSLKDSEVFQQAKITYQCPGMPVPDVQVDVRSVAEKKYAAMQAYTTEQPNILRVWLFYDKVDAETYFSIFSNEYYHVIDVTAP